jgi:hypothetical protein
MRSLSADRSNRCDSLESAPAPRLKLKTFSKLHLPNLEEVQHEETCSVLLVLIFSLPAIAVEDGQAMYLGGTAQGVNAGVIGRMDTTAETSF